MQDWLAGETGGQYLTAILWTVGALVLLAIVLIVVRMLRRGATAFGSHGRDRRPRLSLGESIEIDNQRRLVLVRRDDVEHLILTGGPSDVVVEQGIRPSPAPARRDPAEPVVGEKPIPRSAATAVPTLAPIRPAEAPRPAAASMEPALDAPPRPAPVPEKAPVMPVVSHPAHPQEERRPEPVAPSPRAAANPAQAAAPSAAAEPAQVAPQPKPAERGPEEDDVVEFPQADATRLRRQEGRKDASLEDEMSRLLEDISDERR